MQSNHLICDVFQMNNNKQKMENTVKTVLSGTIHADIYVSIVVHSSSIQCSFLVDFLIHAFTPNS